MGHMVGLVALIPTMMLLTVSYFVLFANRKVEGGPLKTFGTAVAVLLWVVAGIILSLGILVLVAGPMHPGWHHGWDKNGCGCMDENCKDGVCKNPGEMGPMGDKGMMPMKDMKHGKMGKAAKAATEDQGK